MPEWMTVWWNEVQAEEAVKTLWRNEPMCLSNCWKTEMGERVKDGNSSSQGCTRTRSCVALAPEGKDLECSVCLTGLGRWKSSCWGWSGGCCGVAGPQTTAWSRPSASKPLSAILQPGRVDQGLQAHPGFWCFLKSSEEP